MDPEAVLRKIYNDKVKVNPAEMQENTYIANLFAESFVNRVASQHGAQRPALVKQGSSFEGLKVGAADEFDYLLVYDYRNRSDYITPVESRNLHSSPSLPAIRGFWLLTVEEARREWIEHYTDLQPPYKRFLAPYKYRRELQTLLNEHVNDCKYGSGTVRVKGFSFPSINDPALTEEITKLDDKKFAIDISIAVKMTLKSGETKTYFAKKHEQDEKTMYWRCTYHDDEKRTIEAMDESIKESYRTAKYLLKEVVQNSFVLKTSLFHLNQSVSHDQLKTKTGFLREMIAFLERSYKQRYLPGFFNREYNVIGKYGEVHLENNANMLLELKKFGERDMMGLIAKLSTAANRGKKENPVPAKKGLEKCAGFYLKLDKLTSGNSTFLDLSG